MFTAKQQAEHSDSRCLSLHPYLWRIPRVLYLPCLFHRDFTQIWLIRIHLSRLGALHRCAFGTLAAPRPRLGEAVRYGKCSSYCFTPPAPSPCNRVHVTVTRYQATEILREFTREELSTGRERNAGAVAGMIGSFVCLINGSCLK